MPRDDDEFENTDIKIGSDVVTVGPKLDSGKEGTVYEIQDSQTEVVKIFEPERRVNKRGKVKEMVRNPPDDPTTAQSDQPALVWPTEAARSVSDEEFLGCSMPRLSIDEFENAQKYARDTLDHDKTIPDFRYLVATDLALKVALVHVNGHAMGDMHHSNILVNDGLVTLIDCDGFHISGKYRDFGGVTVYPRYGPPDTRSETDDVETVQLSDRFGLAVHIFQFLMAGYHPFVAIGSEAARGSTKNAIHGNKFPYGDPQPGRLEPPDRAPDYDWLSAEIKGLFDAAFINGKQNPEYRPTAKDWVNALARASSMDTKGSDPVRPNTPTQSTGTDGSDSSESRQTKWERQRQKRRRQQSKSDSDESRSNSASDTPRDTSTGGPADGGSYSRSSSNWAEEIRNESSSNGDSDSGATSASSGSGPTSISSTSSGSTSNYSSTSSSASGTNSSDTGITETIIAWIIVLGFVGSLVYLLLIL